MNLKIAVGSTDGKVVNAHFGRTPQFYIFEMTENDIFFIEIRKNLPGCSSLDTPLGTMDDTIKLITDCDYVLVSQIGKPMVERLMENDIQPKIIRNLILDALNELRLTLE